jgi:hypothetical protein
MQNERVELPTLNCLIEKKIIKNVNQLEQKKLELNPIMKKKKPKKSDG